MSLILALVVATIIILIRMMYKEKPREEAKPVLVKRYVHPGHTWMKLTQDGDVIVGIDEFGQSVIGSIDEIQMPGEYSQVWNAQGWPSGIYIVQLRAGHHFTGTEKLTLQK